MVNKQKNELLLLQLQHLQEELEYYYAKYQELNSGTFFRGGAVIEHLEVEQAYQDGNYYELKLVVEAMVAGKRYDKVRLKLADHGGVPAVVLRADENDSILSSWPEGMRDGDCDRLLVKLGGSLFDETLSLFSSKDWMFIYGLLLALTDYLYSKSSVFLLKLPSDYVKEGKSWGGLSRELLDGVSKFSNLLRWDRVNVRETVIAQGYERTWIVLKNCTYAQKLLGDYHFKLELKQRGEQKELILIFRDQDDGSAPLSSWPPLHHDDFGPVLRLKYDFIRKGVDVESVEESIISSDIDFISEIINNLPRVFKEAGEGLADSVIPLLLVPKPLSAVAVPLLEWGSVEVFESYDAGRYIHLGIRLKELSYKGASCQDYDFKLFIRQFSKDLDEAIPGIELRSFDGIGGQSIKWPAGSTEYDDYGAVLTVQLFNGEIVGLDSFESDGREFLACLIQSLPAVIEMLDGCDYEVKFGLELWSKIASQLSDKVTFSKDAVVEES